MAVTLFKLKNNAETHVKVAKNLIKYLLAAFKSKIVFGNQTRVQGLLLLVSSIWLMYPSIHKRN